MPATITLIRLTYNCELCGQDFQETEDVASLSGPLEISATAEHEDCPEEV